MVENQVNGQEMKHRSVKEAKKRILNSIHPINKTEILNLDECMNRVLAKPLISKRTHPSFNTSSMDGYAITNTCLLYTSPSPRD